MPCLAGLFPFITRIDIVAVHAGFRYLHGHQFLGAGRMTAATEAGGFYDGRFLPERSGRFSDSKAAAAAPVLTKS